MAMYGHFFGHYVLLRILSEDGKHTRDDTAFVGTNLEGMYTEIGLATGEQFYLHDDRPMIKILEQFDSALGYFATITLYGPKVDDVRPVCGEVQSVLMSKFPSYFDSFFNFLGSGKWENVPSWPLAFESA